jgi:tetratricopeptide (TPR) repeat protein
MARIDAKCPSLEELDAIASGSSCDDVIREHARHCSDCARELQRLESNAEFLNHYAPGDAGGETTDAPPSIEGYEILREAHRGGQGVVYEAMQLSTNRRVAIKALTPGAFATSAARQRFLREIEIAARLDHPNLVVVHDGGVDATQRPYVVMGWIDGSPIDEHVLREGFDTGRVVSMLVPVCIALGRAHACRIVHRDIKPANILIDSGGRAHVVDFGLARAAGPSSSDVTTEGSFLGTLAYASPEHVSGRPDSIDARSDVYALGVVLYELLCSAPPYPVRGRLDEAIRSIVHTEPRRLRSAAPPERARKLDADLESIVFKALEKSPRARYADASALGADLTCWLQDRPVAARRVSTTQRLSKAARRNPGWAAAIAIALVSILMLANYLWTASAERDRAERRGDAANILAGLATVEDQDQALKIISVALGLDPDSWQAYLERATRLAPHLLRAAEAEAQQVARSGEHGAEALSNAIRTRFGDFERAVELAGEADDKARILIAAGDAIRHQLAQGPSGLERDAWWIEQMDAYYTRAGLWSDDLQVQLLPLRARSADPHAQVEAAREITHLEQNPRLGALPSFWQIQTQVYLGGPYHSFPIEHRARNLEKALAAADRWAVAQEPGNGYAWYMLGHTYVQSGRWYDAMPALERAITLLRESDFDPAHADNWLAPALADLGTSNAHAGDFEHAFALLSEALDLSGPDAAAAASGNDGRSPIIAVQWAEAAHLAGDRDEARRLLALARDIVRDENALGIPSRVIPTAWALLTFADPALRDPRGALQIITRMRAGGHMTDEPAAIHVEMLARFRTDNPRKVRRLAGELVPAARDDAYALGILALLDSATWNHGRAASSYARARERAASLDDARLARFLDDVASEIGADEETTG